MTASGGGGALFARLPQKVSKPAEVVPVRYNLSFSVAEADKGLIEEARVALSSRFPKGASFEQLFTEGLRSIIKEQGRKLQVLGSRKGKEQDRHKRTATAKIEKAVRERDGHCCSYVFEDGSRCQSQWQLEIDHVKPVSLGGKTEVENLRLLCRAHNQYLGRQIVHS